MKKFITVFALLMTYSVNATEQEPIIELELQAYVQAPANWQTEIINLPFEFAPNIPLQGTEELIFSPQMYELGQEKFFSYCLACKT